LDIREINGELLAKMLVQATAKLNQNRALVDSLNVFPVPDGDTGTNMSLTMNAAMIEIAKTPTTHAGTLAKAMSKGSLMGARGNSGVILSQIFRGFAKGCQDKEVLTSIDLALAVKEASDTAYKAVMKPVEGTILTVIRKTGELALEYTEHEISVHELLAVLIQRAEETLERTPDYLPVLKQAGVVDAGGMGLVFIMKGFMDAILGLESTYAVEEMNAGHVQAELSPEDITFTYCTEFILKSKIADVTYLRNNVQKMGDSMVFVQDDDLIKVHVHTDNPGAALEEALKFGDLLTVKIENMREQHSSLVDAKNMDEVVEKESHGNHNPAPNNVLSMPKAVVEETVAPYGIVSIAVGEGLAQILKDLGVNVIVEGGQTMNPSTEDIIKAIEACNAETIFVLPNNSNIILAANQAKDILSDKNIFVLPTKTVPQGISALIQFNAEKDAHANFEHMKAAIDTVKTLQVTFSVRDTIFNGLDIEKDDILGVADGTIIQVGKSVESVTLNALDELIDEDSEIITLYYGEDLNEEAAQALADQLMAKHAHIEVEVHNGGQPLYYYIASVE
jgi:DAK2 domain fusion protein YloV